MTHVLPPSAESAPELMTEGVGEIELRVVA
jgi:hypothetical protein